MLQKKKDELQCFEAILFSKGTTLQAQMNEKLYKRQFVTC